MALFKKKNSYAIIFDDKGEFYKLINITKKHKLFSFQNKTFNVLKKDASNFQLKGLLNDSNYYFYNINNPNPIIMDSTSEPIMNTDLYNIMIKTEVAKKLNSMNKLDIFEYLTPQNIVIGVVIIIVLFYILQGNLI